MRYTLNPLIIDKKQKIKKLSNSDLAKLSGLGISTIQNVRAGKPCNGITALRIATALNVKVEDIQKKEEEKEDDC